MYTKTELKKIAEEQKYVYVLLSESLNISKYPTSKIDFKSKGSQAIIDIENYYGEITVYKTLEDALFGLNEDVDFEIEDNTLSYLADQNRLRNIKDSIKDKDKKHMLVRAPLIHKRIFVNLSLASGNPIERIMDKLGLTKDDFYVSRSFMNPKIITWCGIEYYLGKMKTGLKIDEEIWEEDIESMGEGNL